MNDYNESINLNYMAKNKLIKNVTIDQLAEMVQSGFVGVEAKLEKVNKDLAIIKGQLAGVVYKPDFDKLEMRVEYLENVLNLPAKKH